VQARLDEIEEGEIARRVGLKSGEVEVFNFVEAMVDV
jgi:hypothetical protein